MKYFNKVSEINPFIPLLGVGLAGSIGMRLWNRYDEQKAYEAANRAAEELKKSKDLLTDSEVVALIKEKLKDKNPGYKYDPLMTQFDAAAYVDDESPLILWGDYGDKGIDRRIILHEIGHAQDYNIGEGSKMRKYEQWPSKKRSIEAEIAAWELSGVPESDPLRQAALDNYKHGPRKLRYFGEDVFRVLAAAGLLGTTLNL